MVLLPYHHVHDADIDATEFHQILIRCATLHSRPQSTQKTIRANRIIIVTSANVNGPSASRLLEVYKAIPKRDKSKHEESTTDDEKILSNHESSEVFHSHV